MISKLTPTLRNNLHQESDNLHTLKTNPFIQDEIFVKIDSNNTKKTLQQSVTNTSNTTMNVNKTLVTTKYHHMPVEQPKQKISITELLKKARECNSIESAVPRPTSTAYKNALSLNYTWNIMDDIVEVIFPANC